jgi:hypothetical protein
MAITLRDLAHTIAQQHHLLGFLEVHALLV